MSTFLLLFLLSWLLKHLNIHFKILLFAFKSLPCPILNFWATPPIHPHSLTDQLASCSWGSPKWSTNSKMQLRNFGTSFLFTLEKCVHKAYLFSWALTLRVYLICCSFSFLRPDCLLPDFTRLELQSGVVVTESHFHQVLQTLTGHMRALFKFLTSKVITLSKVLTFNILQNSAPTKRSKTHKYFSFYIRIWLNFVASVYLYRFCV